MKVNGNRKKVLVVDDESNIAQMMAMMLETRGYDVNVAGSGEEAIAKARSEERRVGKECRSRWSPYH